MTFAHFNFMDSLDPEPISRGFMEGPGYNAMPLFALYATTRFGRYMYNKIDAYHNFYTDISKKNVQLNKTNKYEGYNVESDSCFSEKNVEKYLTPYGNLYITTVKDSCRFITEIGLTIAAHVIPVTFPVAATIEIYTVGNAFYYAGSSAYGFLTKPSINEQMEATKAQNPKKADWFLSGFATMAADNMLHVAFFGPLMFVVEMYAVKLAVQSWRHGSELENEIKIEDTATLEKAKDAPAPLLFGAHNINDVTMAEIAQTEVDQVKILEVNEPIRAKTLSPQ